MNRPSSDPNGRYLAVTLSQPAAADLAEAMTRAESGKASTLLIELTLGPQADAHPASAAEIEQWLPSMRRLQALEMPVVCAVQGHARGLYASLALACDVVVAAEKASFHLSLGEGAPMPAGGATYWLPRQVGMVRALGMLLLADKVTAPEAQQKGLIWRCVPDDRLIDEGRGIAQYFAAQPAQTLAAIKRALRAGLGNSFDAQLDLESELHRTLASHA